MTTPETLSKNSTREETWSGGACSPLGRTTSKDAPKPQGSNDSTHEHQADEKGSADQKNGESAGTSEFDVYWDEPADQDPENPMNWSTARKWSTMGMVSFVTFLSPLASSMVAPGVPHVLKDFQTSSVTLAGFVVSVYVLGFAFGPLIIAPLSEYYGRIVVYNVCNVLFLVFTIISAVSQNMAMLVVFRFLAGFVGVAPITCGSGTIADVMPREKRGVAMSLWSLGPLFGPIIGPIAGGFLVEATGWRWVFWVLAIASGVTTVVFFFVVKETYAPVLLERKAARLRKETGNPAYRSRLSTGLPPKQLFLQSVIRPTKMLFLSPIIAMMCVYIAILYGLLYILFTTFTFVYEGQYHFSTSAAGLSFIGSGVGMLCGLAWVASFSDRAIRKKLSQNITPRPEDRLAMHLVLPGCLCVPAGLFIYGWAADKHTYLVDAFTVYAASATAANTVLRSLLGALLPLCGLDLYNAIGLGWGNSLLGFIALGLAPIPMLFYMFGERVRTSPRFRTQF
ncbi:major facilitator superfamily domain-containing protein [Aspergillus floccosus]